MVPTQKSVRIYQGVVTMSLATDSPRWCDVCAVYGNHHTDRHDHMVNGIPLEDTYRINGVEHSVRDGVLMRKVDGQWSPVSQPKAKRTLFRRR
jgi:hypothetical protein